jgi:Leucine-rich repeat (LRR) protein
MKIFYRSSLKALAASLISLHLKHMIYDNHLTGLPESICSLTKLKILNIGNNRIESLPENIGDLINSELPDAGYNKLFSLPKSIKKLANL